MSDLLVVLGKDPFEAGGHSSYLKAFCRAAIRAGHTPHLFYAHTENVTSETPFGVLHGAASPLRWILRPRPGMAYRSMLLAFHRRVIRRRMERFLAGRSGRFVTIAPGPWGAISIDLRDRLENTDIEIVPVAIAWSDAGHEFAAKRHGVGTDHGVGARIRTRLEYEWATRTVVPAQHRALRESVVVIANYQSVVSLIDAATPGHAPVEILPYASEEAFDDPWNDRPAPEPMAGDPGVATIVSVSRHDPRKGIDVLIRSLAILRDRGASFRAIVVGPGALQHEHEALVERLNLGDLVSITGFVADRVGYLQHADLFVLPSTEESSGSISMLEAMQAGLAIVASAIDGIPEDVTDEEDALLVPAGDAYALAKALQRVVENPLLRTKLQVRSRQRFEERFSADTFADAIDDLLDRVRSAMPPRTDP